MDIYYKTRKNSPVCLINQLYLQELCIIVPIFPKYVYRRLVFAPGPLDYYYYFYYFFANGVHIKCRETQSDAHLWK